MRRHLGQVIVQPGDVFRIAMPRTDLAVTVKGVPIKAPCALGSYAAFKVLQLRWTSLLLATAFAGFIAMTVLDVSGRSATVEESLKLLAETFIVIALLAASHDPMLRAHASEFPAARGSSSRP